jgi:hypothetical protein
LRELVNLRGPQKAADRRDAGIPSGGQLPAELVGILYHRSKLDDLERTKTPSDPLLQVKHRTR